MNFNRPPGTRALKRVLLGGLGSFAIYGRKPEVANPAVDGIAGQAADTDLLAVPEKSYLRVGGRINRNNK